MKVSALIFSASMTPSLIIDAGIDHVAIAFLIGMAAVAIGVVYTAVTETH